MELLHLSRPSRNTVANGNRSLRVTKPQIRVPWTQPITEQVLLNLASKEISPGMPSVYYRDKFLPIQVNAVVRHAFKGVPNPTRKHIAELLLFIEHRFKNVAVYHCETTTPDWRDRLCKALEAFPHKIVIIVPLYTPPPAECGT
jgi:hypothetical protein